MTLQIDFESQISALFDVYFWPFNKSHEKIIAIFVISATMSLIWNVFIKFRWHDEKPIKAVLVGMFPRISYITDWSRSWTELSKSSSLVPVLLTWSKSKPIIGLILTAQGKNSLYNKVLYWALLVFYEKQNLRLGLHSSGTSY